MTTRDVPREEWDRFLHRFNHDHRDEPVTVAKSDTRDGLRFADRAAPLMEIAHLQAPERISVTVRETPFGDVTHTLREPGGITVDQPAEGDDDPRVSIDVTGRGEHLVIRVDRPRSRA